MSLQHRIASFLSSSKLQFEQNPSLKYLTCFISVEYQNYMFYIEFSPILKVFKFFSDLYLALHFKTKPKVIFIFFQLFPHLRTDLRENFDATLSKTFLFF